MKTLVAGIGNIFNSDDGFGVEVAQHLARRPQPDFVHVEDYGIRGVHLAYELLEGYDLVVLIDTIQRGDAPGTVYMVEPDPDVQHEPMDAHRMDPHAVLGMVARMGGEVGRCVVVGCEPANLDEGMGLSPPVQAAIEGAALMVEELIARKES